jgi:hypothetical protein
VLVQPCDPHLPEGTSTLNRGARHTQMLAGTPYSAEFIAECQELRRWGSPIEQALVMVGHEFRLREPEHQMILR